MKKRTRIRISGRIYRGYRGPCVDVTATGEFRDKRYYSSTEAAMWEYT
jgi:hypothetical protein